MVDLDEGQWALRRGSLVYPSPVAIACGRVLRARTASDRVNACLKAGEVLARYLAAVAVASFATREEDGETKLSELQWQPRVRPLLDHGSGSRSSKDVPPSCSFAGPRLQEDKAQSGDSSRKDGCGTRIAARTPKRPRARTPQASTRRGRQPSRLSKRSARSSLGSAGGCRGSAVATPFRRREPGMDARGSHRSAPPLDGRVFRPAAPIHQGES